GHSGIEQRAPGLTLRRKPRRHHLKVNVLYNVFAQRRDKLTDDVLLEIGEIFLPAVIVHFHRQQTAHQPDSARTAGNLPADNAGPRAARYLFAVEDFGEAV